MKNELEQMATIAKTRKIEELFKTGTRLDKLCLQFGECFFDFSKSQMSEDELVALIAYAKEKNLGDKIKAMFSGDAINTTENRAVLHVALRNHSRNWRAKGEDANDYKEVMKRASAFAQKVFDGSVKAKNGKPFSAILHIGIGGSDLGPRMVYEALRPIDATGPILRFCANVEPTEFAQAVAGIDPETTLIVCVSKTFTTIETLTNFALARDWLQAAIGTDDKEHLVAISSAPDKAMKYGIKEDRIFGFDEWVGGRYSVWSTVGLSLEMSLGSEIAKAFLDGAKAMDEHFETTDIAQNIPLLGGLIGYWNHTHLGYTTRAIIPYAARLKLLPQFLQQLDMESNGKGIDKNNNPIAISGPVVWGAEGTNAQHAFFQHLHQSPQITPVEFIIIKDGGTKYAASNQLTLANALAQSEALMRGKSLEMVKEDMRKAGKSDEEIEKIAPHRVFTGNRPNICVVLPKLGAYEIGALIAFYEHRTLVEGLLWDINSFDQWGVELGKVIALEINEDLTNGASEKRDPSTANLIKILS